MFPNPPSPSRHGIPEGASIDAMRRQAYDLTRIKDRVSSIESLTKTALVPPGGLLPYAGTASPNVGWLLCDGASYLRTDYPRLFAAIGTTFGSADSTHFNVPDLRGRVPVALDNLGGSDAGRLSVANTLGGSGGTETHTLSSTESGTAAHGHSNTLAATLSNQAGTTNVLYSGVSGGTLANVAVTGASFRHGNTTIAITGSVTDHAGAAAASAHNNMQPYILTGYLIKT